MKVDLEEVTTRQVTNKLVIITYTCNNAALLKAEFMINAVLFELLYATKCLLIPSVKVNRYFNSFAQLSLPSLP